MPVAELIIEDNLSLEVNPVVITLHPEVVAGPNAGLGAVLLDYTLFSQSPTWSGAASISIDNGNVAHPVLAGNVTSIDITDWGAAGTESKLILYLKQVTGPYTITGWPGAITWVGGSPPPISTNIGDTDIIVLTTVDAGVNIIGTYIGRAY